MSRTALILQHGDSGPPAILAEWCAARAIAFEVHHAQSRAPLPELNGQAFVASLGSPHNPDEEHVDQVAAEVAFIGEAAPELGWYAVETVDPAVVPAGPWLQWHFDAFTLPPGAEQLAVSDAGVQAFAHGPHLGEEAKAAAFELFDAFWERAR